MVDLLPSSRASSDQGVPENVPRAFHFTAAAASTAVCFDLNEVLLQSVPILAQNHVEHSRGTYYSELLVSILCGLSSDREHRHSVDD